MPTWFAQITVESDLIDLTPDSSSRARYAFNILSIKQPSDTFDMELVAILQNAGVGTYGTSIFVSSRAEIPTGDGPYIEITETGGLKPIATHNSVAVPAYPQPGAQIVVVAKTKEAARAKVKQAWNALGGIRNQSVTAAT